MALLTKFAASMGMDNHLEVVSLGKGQGPRAEEVIKVNGHCAPFGSDSTFFAAGGGKQVSQVKPNVGADLNCVKRYNSLHRVRGRAVAMVTDGSLHISDLNSRSHGRAAAG